MRTIEYVVMASALGVGALLFYRRAIQRRRSAAREADDRQAELIRLYTPAVRRALAEAQA